MRKIISIFIFILWLNPSYAEQTQDQTKEQAVAPKPTIKEQPHPTPIHPCAPLEQCMPPSY